MSPEALRLWKLIDAGTRSDAPLTANVAYVQTALGLSDHDARFRLSELITKQIFTALQDEELRLLAQGANLKSRHFVWEDSGRSAFFRINQTPEQYRRSAIASRELLRRELERVQCSASIDDAADSALIQTARTQLDALPLPPPDDELAAGDGRPFSRGKTLGIPPEELRSLAKALTRLLGSDTQKLFSKSVLMSQPLPSRQELEAFRRKTTSQMVELLRRRPRSLQWPTDDLGLARLAILCIPENLEPAVQSAKKEFEHLLAYERVRGQRQSLESQIADAQNRIAARHFSEQALLAQISEVDTDSSLLVDETTSRAEYVREHIPRAVQREVWRRDQGRCTTCGSRESLHFDHIIPVSKGGSHTIRNIQLLCEKCNLTKSNKI